MTKEEKTEILYHIISPICKFVNLQHRDGDWCEVCTYTRGLEEDPICNNKNCVYLKI